MAPLGNTSERSALMLYLSLLLISLAILFFGSAPPLRWISRTAAALYWPYEAVSFGMNRVKGALLEGDELRGQAAELRRQRALVAELSDENVRLRGQLGFSRRDTLHLIPAWVLAKRGDRTGTRVLVNRGELDGVRPGCSVISRQGLVGRVDAVEPHMARVRLLLDRGSAVSARVERSHVDGVVEGDPLEGLRLRFVSTSADVKVGDDIVTSGLGGAFPPALPVGKVKSLSLEEGGLLRRIQIAPAAAPEYLEDVFVLLAPDSSAGWGYLWARPVAPTDSLAGSVRADRIDP